MVTRAGVTVGGRGSPRGRDCHRVELCGMWWTMIGSGARHAACTVAVTGGHWVTPRT